MQYVLNSKEMKEADEYTISNFISSIDLMEKAGNAIFKYLKDNFSKEFKYLIVTGSGNNGGDGFVVARLLLNEGYDVDVFEAGKAKSKEAIQNKNKFFKNTFSVDNKDIDLLIDEKTIIIDAIFGYGLNKEINEPYFSLIKKINDNSKKFKVISIDISSGISANTGKALGIAIKADITLAIGAYKLGYFLNDGKDFNKKVVLLNIGIVYPNKEKEYLINLENDDFKTIFNQRKSNSNKGSYGKVTLIGGMENTPGALSLAKRAYLALRLGVGYSELAFPKSLTFIYSSSLNEIIYHPLKDKLNGSLKYNKKELASFLSSKVITIGMGIGVSKDVYKIIKYFLKNFRNNLIIDADGLNSLAKYGVEILKDKTCNVILTPHMKEFSRLSHVDIDELKIDRLKHLRKFVEEYDVIVALKDNSTIIYSKDEKYININGNSGLAKGGSGDVLSGIISGCVANSNSLIKSVALGSYILGRCSEINKEKKRINEYSMVSSDIINSINDVVNEIIGE